MTATPPTPEQQIEIEYRAAVLRALLRYALDGHPLSFDTRPQDGHTIITLRLADPELAPYMAHLDLA